MANYQIILRDSFGRFLGYIEDYAKVELARKIMEVGTLDLYLYPNFNTSLLKIDGRIEVWRKVGVYPQYLEGETPFFIRQAYWTTADSGEELLRITALDPIDLLKRRIVPYDPTDVKSAKWDVADDVLKDIFAENLGASVTDAARNLSTYINVDPKSTLAPMVQINIGRRVVLDAMKDVAAAALQTVNGKYVAFDIVWDDESHLRFKTYIDRRGMDHSSTSAKPVTVSASSGNVTGPTLLLDYSQEVNVVYAGGAGSGASQITTISKDDTRIGLSPFNRCEQWVADTNEADINALQAAADAACHAGRPKKYFSGKIVDGNGFIFGRDCHFGDTIVTIYKGESFDSIIDTEHITFSPSEESVELNAKGEAYV